MNSEKVFKPSLAKGLLLLVVSLAFVVIGLATVHGDPLFGWIVILLFGAGSLAAVTMLVTGRPALRLDEDGIEIVGLTKSQRILWTDIESIGLQKVGRTTAVALRYRKDHPRRRQVSRSLTGFDIVIPSTYSPSKKELYNLLQDWHLRYGNTK